MRGLAVAGPLVWLLVLVLPGCGGRTPSPASPEVVTAVEAPKPVRDEAPIPVRRRVGEPPAPMRKTIASGLRLVCLRDATAPVVRIELAVQAGSVFEPPGKTGLAELAAAVARTGGTGTIPEEVFEVKLQDLEAALEIEAGPELTVLSATCPPAAVGEVLELIGSLMVEPRQAKETVRREALRIEQRWNARLASDPGSVLVESCLRNEGSQAGRVEQLREISPTDVSNFHSLCYRPARACLGVAGPLEPERVADLAEKGLARWKSEGLGPSVRWAPLVPQSVSWLPDSADPGEVVAFIPGARPELRDAIAHEVLVECLTRDGLGGRISRQVAKAGIAEQDLRVARREGSDGGCWVVRLAVPAAKTVLALQAFREALASLATEHPTQRELATAVARVRFRLLRASATPARQVALQAREEALGQPPNYLAASLRRLDELTPGDLRMFLQERRSLEPSFALLGGPKPDKESFLVNLRPEAPPPKPVLGSQPASGTEVKASAMLALAVHALGGEKRLREVLALSYERTVRGRDDLPVDESTVALLPDKIRRVERVLSTQIMTVVAGDKGASRSPKKVLPLEPGECASLTGALLRNPVILLARLAGQPSAPVRLVKRESVDDRWLQVLEVRLPGSEPIRIAVDEENGLVRRVSGTEWRPMRGPVPVEEEFEDYRPVGALRFPHRSLLWMEGEFHSEGVFRKVAIIPAPGDEMFVIPTSPASAPAVDRRSPAGK